MGSCVSFICFVPARAIGEASRIKPSPWGPFVMLVLSKDMFTKGPHLPTVT